MSIQEFLAFEEIANVSFAMSGEHSHPFSSSLVVLGINPHHRPSSAPCAKP